MTATIASRSRRHRAASHDRASIGRTDRRRSGAPPPVRTVGVRDAASSIPPAGTRRVPMVAGYRKAGVTGRNGKPSSDHRPARAVGSASAATWMSYSNGNVDATAGRSERWSRYHRLTPQAAANGSERPRPRRTQAHPGDQGFVCRVRKLRADGERGDGEARRGPSVRFRTASRRGSRRPDDLQVAFVFPWWPGTLERSHQ